MIVKCARREFDCNKDDLILDNGACYILITKKYYHDWVEISPIVAKATFKKLLKEGKIRLSKKKYKDSFGNTTTYSLYEFVEDKNENN